MGEIVGLEDIGLFIVKYQESGQKEGKQSCYTLFHMFLDEQTLQVAIRRFKSIVSVQGTYIFLTLIYFGNCIEGFH